MGSGASDNDEIISENEDELERQLAELQRKLALKRKQTGSAPSSPARAKPAPPTGLAALPPPQSPKAHRDRGPPEIEVPKTPPRRRVSELHGTAQQSPLKTPPSLGRVRLSQSPVIRSPTSPARVLLGIDKGLSGWDVNLKRPPKGSPQASPFASPKRPRESLQSSTQPIKPVSTSFGLAMREEIKTETPTLTFAQKLKKTKELDQLQKKKTQEMRDKRRQGFSIPTNAGHAAAQDTRKPTGTSNSGISRAAQTALAAAATSPDDIYEPFARFRLSKQPALDFDTLKTQFGDAQILTVSQLYAEVSPPGFEPPQYCNWILVAVVAKKSKVMDRPSGGNNGGSQKFVMLTLTDLGAFEVSLSVQGPAFDKYWKVSPGAVIAVLNPGIYQTRKKIFDPSGQSNTDVDGTNEGGPKTFGLYVTDASFTTILEIGHSRDLGKCAATTAKGHPCSNWVNARKATYCDFHAEARVRKARSGRMEMNSVAQGQPVGKYGLGSSKTVVMMSSGKLFHGSGSSSSSKDVAPDYVNKVGLIDDPLAPGRKYSKEHGQVWTSVSSSFAGPGFQHRTAFDAALHGGGAPPLSEQAQKAKAAKLAKERRIREALMRRPDGVQLRYYDEKGNQLGLAGAANSSGGSSTASTTSTTAAATKDGTGAQEPRPAFRPEHIRRIGFNPLASISGSVPDYAHPALAPSITHVTGIPAVGGGSGEDMSGSNIRKKRPVNVSEDVDLSITMTHKQRRLQHQQQRASSESSAAAAATTAGVATEQSIKTSSSVQMSPQKLKLKQMLANLSSSLKNDLQRHGDNDDDDDDLEIV